LAIRLYCRLCGHHPAWYDSFAFDAFDVFFFFFFFGYSTVFFFIFFYFLNLIRGLALSSNLSFGDSVPPFSDFVSAFLTLLNMIMFTFEQLELTDRMLKGAERMLWRIFYWAFVLFVNHILINTFIAVTFDAFNTVRKRSDEKKRLGVLVLRFEFFLFSVFPFHFHLSFFFVLSHSLGTSGSGLIRLYFMLIYRLLPGTVLVLLGHPAETQIYNEARLRKLHLDENVIYQILYIYGEDEKYFK
jgi:hypothetical protein